MLEELYEDLLAHGGRNGQPLALGTIRICHTVLRGALRDAQLDGLVETNPAKHARTPRRDPTAREIEDRTPVWTIDEVARFLEQVDGHPWRALWHLAVGTGARRDEQQRHRRVAADGWRDQWGLVFTEPDGAYLVPNRVTQTFRRLVESLEGLPVIHLHILRHTHASLLLEQGAPIKLISERLGHSSYHITMDTYAHLMPAMDQEAVDRFDSALRACRRT